MTIKGKKFKKSIITQPTTSAATEEGEIRNDSADNKLKTYTEGAEREVVTADQTQTLENKTIDSASNTVTVDADEATVENLEVDNLKAGVLETDLNNAVDDTNIPSAQAVKTYVAQEVETVDDASEITYDPAGNPETTATDVQAALDDTGTASQAAQDAADAAQTSIDDHIADTDDAHSASAISNSPAGNLAATDVQAALNELQTDVDTRATQTALDDHINDAADAHDASAISYDNATSGLTATDSQAAIDEIEGRVDTVETDVNTAQTTIDDHIADAADAHDASAINVTPAGNLASTDAQAALEELQTDVDTRATDADLTAHTGATSGVHGVTGDVVGTTDAQTLTQKTIQGASIEDPERLDPKKDTLANLQTYATTAQNGELVFATDNKQSYQVVDGALTAIAGGGAGGLDIYYTEDFENAQDVSGFSTGNDAAFMGGGTLQGTLALEETDEISGTKSLSYTQAAGSLNDYFASETIDVDFKQQNNDSGQTLYFTYDGNDDDIKLVVWDETNSEELTSGVELIKEESTARRYALSFYVPATCNQIRWGAQVLVENSGAELIVDDVEITSDPFVFGLVNEENDFSVNVENNGSTAVGTTKAPNYQWWDSITRDSTGQVTIDYTSLGLTEIPSILATPAREVGDDTNTVNARNASTTSVQIRVYSAQGTNFVDDDFFVSLRKHSADYVAPSEHVLTPARGSSTETKILSSSVSTAQDIFDLQFDNLIVGNTYLISGVTTLVSLNGTATTLSFRDSSGGTGNLYGNSTLEGNDGTGDIVAHSPCIIFTATSSTLYTRFNQGDTLIGDGTRANTFLQLTNLTSQFLAAIPTPKTAYIKDVKPSGTNGGTFTSGSWQTRDLNELSGDTGFVSLSGNQVTIQPGKYKIKASAPSNQVNRNVARFRNITDSVDSIIGTVSFSDDVTATAPGVSSISGTVVITKPTTFEIQHQCESSQAGNGFGISASFGVDEVYTVLEIEKIG